MKKKMKRFLAFVVAFAMVFTLMPGNSLVLRAEEKTSGDIGEADYVTNGEGISEFIVNSESTFGTVTVPAGYYFTVDRTCTVTTLGLKADTNGASRLNVFSTLNVTSIEADEGAEIFVGPDCVINGIKLYCKEKNAEGQLVEYAGGMDWQTFRYDGSNWIHVVESKDVAENDYKDWEGNPIEEISIWDESAFGTVLVPAKKMFTIDGKCQGCSVDTLYMKAESTLNVLGTLKVTNVTAEQGAKIFVGPTCKINGITLYENENTVYSGDYNYQTFEYTVIDEIGKWILMPQGDGPRVCEYGPIEFNVSNLGSCGTVSFKVTSASLEENSDKLFPVGGNEQYSDEDIQVIFESWTPAANDTITIFVSPSEGNEFRGLEYRINGGEDLLSVPKDRDKAMADAKGKSGFTVELRAGDKIRCGIDLQPQGGGSPNPGLQEGEIGIEILKQGNGSISVSKEPKRTNPDDFGAFYVYDKTVLDNNGTLTVTITPDDGYKVSETLSYADGMIFSDIDAENREGFRQNNGTYRYVIDGSMYNEETSIVKLDIEFEKADTEEKVAKGGEGLNKPENMEGYASSKFTVNGNGADGVSVGVTEITSNAEGTDYRFVKMVERNEDERVFRKYYNNNRVLPYATTLDNQTGYYRYNADENGGKVRLEFHFNYMYRMKSLTINRTEYGVGENKVTTFGNDSVVFTDLIGDSANRGVLLRAFKDQDFGFTVDVDKADAYNISFEVIPVAGYFDEYQGDGRYGKDVVIGNFLWFPTGGDAKDTGDAAMTHGHLEIVSYEIPEADANSLGLTEAERAGTINSDSSFGRKGSAFYFHSPSAGNDGVDRENGEAVFPVGTKLICKLVPDYGYQLADFTVNGNPLKPLEKVSTFEYIVGQGNFHFGATFVPAENKLDCKASENVSAVTIDNDENAATSGTLALTVKDEATVDEMVTSEYGEAISTIDLTLVNEVKKSETEYWEKTISEFEKPVTISLTLDPTEFTEASYKVVRNHITKDSNGVETNVVEELENVSYNKTTGELSFETNKFSAYTIVKETCNHAGEKETKNVKVATCTEKGYSGDVYCKSCNTMITEGREIPSLGHSYVAKVNPAIANQLAASATCVSKAKYYIYCSACNDLSTDTFTYGEVDKTNHTGEKEVRDAKAATCVADGYTGDTYCKSCNTKLSDGEVIKAAGHKYDAGKVTKEPTVDTEGVKTYTCTVCGATKTEAIAKLPKPVDDTPAVNVSYHTHIQTLGDSQGVKTNGQMAGTSGQAKRLENIWIKVEGNSNLGIQYSTHCQSYGWMAWTENGEPNGTSGEAKRLEAIKIELTGADRDKYDVYYRVHAQSYGWLAWVKNGASAGTAGLAKRLEGIQVVVVKKGEAAPGLDYADVKASTGVYTNQGYISGSTSGGEKPGIVTVPNVMYKTHVQTYGWEQNWKKDGEVSGTSGEAKRLEAINIKLSNCEYEGGIQYITHVQTYGWSQGWKKDGEMSGTSGEAKRLEAIKIELTGELKNHYDVYYRVHVQTYGWLAWAKNGEAAGTEGLAKRAEGIQIIILPKGEIPPANYEGIQSVQTKALIK